MPKRSAILPTVIDYFMVSGSHLQLNPSAEKLNRQITDVVREIDRRLENRVLPFESCQEFTDEIDKLLAIAADFSMRKIGGDEIEVLKERIWFLLESLEYHCTKNHNLSIW